MGGRRRRRSRASREDEWIEWIRKQVGPAPSQRFPLGIGDDAALWRPPPRSDIVLTVDCQAAGTHFERGWLKPRELGFRAVSSSVSDLAAMAARPGALLVSLLIDERLRPSGFRELYRGICEASSMYSMPVVGGNVARGPLSVTVTALGSVERRGALLRGDLGPGDEVWVTGCPGLARLGLLSLQGKLGSSRGVPGVRSAVDAFKRPRARLLEARALKRGWPLRALIDLSDGLGRDLEHLLAAAAERRGRLGVELEEAALSRLEPLRRLAEAAGLSPAAVALEGGEDYELLLVTRPRPHAERAARSFERRFGLALTRLGEISRRPGIWLRQPDGSSEATSVRAFEHFAPR